ncbi:hypothetical protein [Pedobacter sp. N23S346]|uniref:hypothetical protein n=1 Tax=Pedobacter sp. N23S346 TaxID=3402750 RepID=UPI003ACD1D8F
MATPVFQQQQPGSPVYLISYGGVNEPLAGYFMPGSAKVSFTFSEAWASNQGVYFFLSEALTDQQAFAKNLQQYLNTPGKTYTRFVWIKNPNGPANQWTIETIVILNGLSNQKSPFSFGSYLFEVAGGCRIDLVQTGTDYVFNLVKAGQTSCFLETASGTNRYALPPGTVVLDFKQATLGCLSFGVELQSNTPGFPDFDTMDIGCRYYIDNEDYTGYLRSLRYPVFEATATKRSITGCLHPAHHFDPALSFFSLTPSGITQLAWKSFYRTNMGQRIDLAPQANARFVFALKPQTKNISSSDPYTLVLQGDFILSANQNLLEENTSENAMMPGISGVEYISLPGNGNLIRFIAGQAAYAPAFSTKPVVVAHRLPDETGLTELATTSWAYFMAQGGGGIKYFAQAEDSLLYYTDQTGTLAPYLGYLQVLNGVLPQPAVEGDSILKAFPSVPYPGIHASDLPLYSQLEVQVLNPVRRKLIEKLVAPLPPPQSGLVTSVTPQGLKLNWDTSCTWLNSITIADGGRMEGDHPTGLLQFTDIKGSFRSALLSNQLFLVVTNMEEFFSVASANYKLGRNAMSALLTAGLPQPLWAKLKSNPSLEGQLYPNLTAYTAALLTKLTVAELEANKVVLMRCGAYAFIEIGGDVFYELTAAGLRLVNDCGANWSVPDPLLNQLINAATVNGKKFDDFSSFQTAVTAIIGLANWNSYSVLLTEYARIVLDNWIFDCSPYIWANPTGKENPIITDPNTILIFKYANVSLEALAADASTWVWPDAAKKQGGSIAQTQSDILTIVNDAKTRAVSERDFRKFSSVVSDPEWNGVLVLNSRISLDTLPDELKGLAAGIDPSRFYAHHIGVDVTPVVTDSGTLNIKRSALFGLINFDDPQDQYLLDTPYAFKVLSLKVLFENSAVTDFYSRVELLISELFGEPAILTDQTHGNNLILNGFYQKQDGKSSYTFVVNGENKFQITSKVLKEIEVKHAEFLTIVPPLGAGNEDTVHSQFILNGSMRFKSLEYFDCFSFGNSLDATGNVVDGWLSFKNLLVNMDFKKNVGQKFSFVASKMFFDVFNSKPRPLSFYSHFPLQMNTLLQGSKVQFPGDLGYMNVSTPLQQGSFTDQWFGFVYNLDLGTLGSLTSDIGLKVKVLIGWAPAIESYNIYVGLNLPGSSSANTEIPIEGILKLVFRKIEVTAAETLGNDGLKQVNYMLKLRGISLKLLSVSFPPGAIDMYLFGNPQSDRSAVGWYAAYSKEKERKKTASRLKRL